MNLPLGDIANLLVLGIGLVGVYVSYVSKIRIMEAELEDLKQLVTELRLDIKELLSK